jgi:hypothetical protein
VDEEILPLEADPANYDAHEISRTPAGRLKASQGRAHGLAARGMGRLGFDRGDRAVLYE